MRDPERIARILDKVKTIWEGCPDLRLGQIVENAKNFAMSDVDTFSVEDDKIEIGLDVWISLREKQE